MKPSVLLSRTALLSPATLRTPFLLNLQYSSSRFNDLFSLNPQFPNPPTRSARCSCSTLLIASGFEPIKPVDVSNSQARRLEETVEKIVYRCRFLTFFGVMGSLVGSLLCFVKGCTVVTSAFLEYSVVNRGKVIMLLLEALDIYLLGTVMLVFGMGMYELFISNLDIAKSHSDDRDLQRSNLFGLFSLMQRPKWLEIKSLNELKTKLGHVIVMLLLIGLFDKSKKAAIHSPTDLLCFSASILLSSCCLFLLSKLNGSA